MAENLGDETFAVVDRWTDGSPALPVPTSTPTPVPMTTNTATMNMAMGCLTVRTLLAYPIGSNEARKPSTGSSDLGEIALSSQSTRPLETNSTALQLPRMH